MQPIVLFWYRRDLRLHDNAGLYHALKSGYPVLPVFIFDTTILDDLKDRSDARVHFIHNTLTMLKSRLNEYGSDIDIAHGTPLQAFELLTHKYSIKQVYTNHDYEPSAISRDKNIQTFLNQKGIEYFSYKDQVIFEKSEILSDTGKPYRVYTPYKNKWLKTLSDFYLKAYPTEKYHRFFFKKEPEPLLTLLDIGFTPSSIHIPSTESIQKIISEYDRTRNYPFLENATSRLGIHFRFGTISIREKARKALPLNDVWVSELIWRDFFMQLLFHFPHVVTESFNSKFNVLRWRNSSEDFAKWCEGKTGYPIVDAGMRELNATGFMHNRVRMVVASFLTKHLFIDWRWGEAYFAEKLLDYDLSANNGNWQWAAGTGADAQPYFRIFNPIAQQERFDPEFIYIKKWVPEFGTSAYIPPMIEHKEAVARAKQAFSILAKP